MPSPLPDSVEIRLDVGQVGKPQANVCRQMLRLRKAAQELQQENNVTALKHSPTLQSEQQATHILGPRHPTSAKHAGFFLEVFVSASQ